MDPVEPVAEERPPAAPAGAKSALAFFAVLLALFLPALFAQWASPVAGLVATQLFAFLVPALVATAGSNLRLAPYLRLRRPRRVLLLLGVLAGGAAYLVGGAIMALTQRVLPRPWVQANDLTRLFEGPAWERIALAAVAALLAPTCEELTFRGYLQTTLALRRRPVGAIAASTVLFATLHLDPVRFPALLVLGAVFGWLTWRGGSIWPAVVAHAANNGLAAGLLLLFGPSPDTAGAASSDVASTLAVAAIGASALALLLRAYRASAPPPEPAAAALALVDPGSPDIRWRAGRVPRGLAALAAAGVASLVLLAAMGLARAAQHAP